MLNPKAKVILPKDPLAMSIHNMACTEMAQLLLQNIISNLFATTTEKVEKKKKVKKKINIPINLTSISYHMDPIRHEIKVSLFLQRTNIIQLSSQNRTTTQVNQVHTILKGTIFSTTNG